MNAEMNLDVTQLDSRSAPVAYSNATFDPGSSSINRTYKLILTRAPGRASEVSNFDDISLITTAISGNATALVFVAGDRTTLGKAKQLHWDRLPHITDYADAELLEDDIGETEEAFFKASSRYSW